MSEDKKIPLIPCSVGEVLDKITILKLKTELCDFIKAATAGEEMEALRQALTDIDIPPNVYEDFETYINLAEINETLWHVEDAIRTGLKSMERSQILMGRMAAVPKLNDQRAALKDKLNQHFKSKYTEVKSYA